MVSNALDEAAKELDGVAKVKSTIRQSIERGIRVLIRDPVALARQTQRLFQTVATPVTPSRTRLPSYGTQVALFTQNTATTGPALANGDLYASGLSVARAQAALNTEFLRRPDAVDAAEEVLNTIDDLAAWRDESYIAVDTVDPGASWQATQDALAFVAGALVSQSFDLAVERSIVLTSERTIIDVAFEVYGTVDDRLDDLINDNDLSGDEIVELPRGREVVYYAS